jgi:NADPH2:quinone reductase
MFAAFYDQQGPAADVLQVGELPDPTPGPGEVRVRLTYSGVNPGDTKKRGGWLGSSMPYPRVIPHSDGAGTIDAVGDGVDRARIGRRVWVWGAQSYRAFGTAAQYTVVPDTCAVDLTTAAHSRALTPAVGTPVSLEQVALAHDRVDAGARGRVLLSIPS